MEDIKGDTEDVLVANIFPHEGRYLGTHTYRLLYVFSYPTF